MIVLLYSIWSYGGRGSRKNHMWVVWPRRFDLYLVLELCISPICQLVSSPYFDVCSIMSSLFTKTPGEFTFSPNHIWPCRHMLEIIRISIDRLAALTFRSSLLANTCVWFCSVAKGRLVPSIYSLRPLTTTTFIRKKAINRRRSNYKLSLEAHRWSSPALCLSVPAIFRNWFA